MESKENSKGWLKILKRMKWKWISFRKKKWLTHGFIILLKGQSQIASKQFSDCLLFKFSPNFLLLLEFQKDKKKEKKMSQRRILIPVDASARAQETFAWALSSFLTPEDHVTLVFVEEAFDDEPIFGGFFFLLNSYSYSNLFSLCWHFKFF